MRSGAAAPMPTLEVHVTDTELVRLRAHLTERAQPLPVSRHLRMRVFSQGGPHECPICLDAVRTFEEFHLSPCGHHAHHACAMRQAQAQCAVCRGPLALEQR